MRFSSFRVIIAVSLLLAALVTTLARAKVPVDVIYGSDSRKEFSDIQSQYWRQIARATAAGIRVSSLSDRGSMTQITSTTLGEDYALCETQRFRDQPSPANCSGFLVAPDILVTAGHCMTGAGDCQNYAWIFDFTSESIIDIGVARVPTSSVYACKKILAQAHNSVTKIDFAVIQLDRAVTDRQPLKFRRNGEIDINTPVKMIGYPSGIPLKLADGGFVRSNGNPIYFTTNLDSFSGNSGSAVLNAETGEVEGILVRGENDYEMGPGCAVIKTCSMNGCRGEDVTRITQVAYLQSAEFQARLRPEPDLDEEVYFIEFGGRCYELLSYRFSREVDLSFCRHSSLR